MHFYRVTHLTYFRHLLQEELSCAAVLAVSRLESRCLVVLQTIQLRTLHQRNPSCRELGIKKQWKLQKVCFYALSSCSVVQRRLPVFA